MTIQTIELETNTYTIDTDDHDTMKNALEAEIRYQFQSRNIELPQGYNGQPHNVNIYINKRSTPSGREVLQFNYSAPYKVISDYKSIRCYSVDPVKSMKDIITKLIKKINDATEVKQHTANKNQEFIDEVKSQFGYADIEFSDTTNYVNQKCQAKISFNEGHITLYQDWHMYITSLDDKKNVIALIDKLLK